MSTKKGLSLIELLIAMGIMSIAAAVVVFSANNFLPSLKLTNSAKAALSSLREAQEEAITTQITHGVHFITNTSPASMVIYKLDGQTETTVKTIALPIEVTISVDQAIINKSYRVAFSSDGGSSVGGNITVTLGSASKYITVSTSGLIKQVAQLPTPTPTPTPPTPSPTATQGHYIDKIAADNYVVGPEGTNVRIFLNAPSGKTSDGICYNKLISATLNIHEEQPIEAFGRKTIQVLYTYYDNVTETNPVPEGFPLYDTGQNFPIYETDSPTWIQIDVTEAMRNALDPSMAFVLQEDGASQYGSTVLKGDNDNLPWGWPGALFVGDQVSNILEGAPFSSIHNEFPSNQPYIELFCNP